MHGRIPQYSDVAFSSGSEARFGTGTTQVRRYFLCLSSTSPRGLPTKPFLPSSSDASPISPPSLQTPSHFVSVFPHNIPQIHPCPESSLLRIPLHHGLVLVPETAAAKHDTLRGVRSDSELPLCQSFCLCPFQVREV